MKRLLALILIGAFTISCGGAPETPTTPSNGSGPGSGGLRLTVTERSATTVSVQWDASPNTTGRYTADHMATAQCGVNVQHDNDLVVGNVTSATIVGLTPSTEYQIHLHRLVGLVAQSTEWNYVLVRTLPDGSGPQPVTRADYTSCGGSG